MLSIFGLLGYFLRLYGYPIAPVIVGTILGPMAEQQLRRTLAIAQGDPATLVQSPLAAIMLAVALIALILPMELRLLGRGRILAAVASDEDQAGFGSSIGAGTVCRRSGISGHRGN